MDLTAESVEKFFPYYLTEERKKGLLEALRDVSKRRYYAKTDDPEPLQGDGWQGLEVIRFEDGARARIGGIVLTNSCDLAADNSRISPARLNFSPLLSLDRYLELLRKNGIAGTRIAQHAKDIRDQIINDIFYMPSDGMVGMERIALLSDIHTIPMSAFQADSGKVRIFSLSEVGFYLFVFKLSVHFCRLHENIDRSAK